MSWFLIVLAHWNNSPRIDMSLHSDTLFWFRANQSLLCLLSPYRSIFGGNKTKYQYYSLWFDPTGVRTHEYAKHYAIDKDSKFMKAFWSVTKSTWPCSTWRSTTFSDLLHWYSRARLSKHHWCGLLKTTIYIHTKWTVGLKSTIWVTWTTL